MKVEQLGRAKFERPIGMQKIFDHFNDGIELSEAVEDFLLCSLIRIGQQLDIAGVTMAGIV
jgi:hypothetical protein